MKFVQGLSSSRQRRAIGGTHFVILPNGDEWYESLVRELNVQDFEAFQQEWVFQIEESVSADLGGVRKR